MTKNDFTNVMLKLLGIKLVIDSFSVVGFIPSLIGTFHTVTDEPIPVSAYFMIVPMIFGIVLGVLLIFKSEQITSLIFRKDIENDISTQLRTKDLQVAAFSVVGVWLFIVYFTEFLHHVISVWKYFNELEPGTSRYVKEQYDWIPTIIVVIKVSMSIALFFGANGLSNVWKKLQVGRYQKVSIQSANKGLHEDN